MAALFRLPNLVAVDNVPEHYVSGIGMVESLDTNMRITMFAERYHGGEMMPVPEVAFVGPTVALPDIMHVLQEAVSERAIVAWSDAWRLLSRQHH